MLKTNQNKRKNLLRTGLILLGAMLVCADVSAVPLPGLTGEYFNNSDFTDTVLTRIDEEIDFRWNQGSPDPGIDSNTFSVRWTGIIVSDATDTHEYRFQHNDGIRVWIDGALVVDAFTSSAQNQESMINIFLTQGPHEITIEYFENTGRAIMKLSERNDQGGGFSVVPSTQLFSELLELLVLDTEFIPSGNIDQNYSVFLSASGGFMPYQWQVSQGILPTGLVLDSLTGQIEGVPTQGGIFPLTLFVEDASFQAAERDVTLTILGAPFIEDLLVDNTDPKCTFVGTWSSSTQRSGFFGTNYQTHRSGDGNNTATWRMSVANSGDYEVFARWVTNNNHATNAKYIVNHSQGTTTVEVDQRTLGAQWISLGIFTFTGGVAGIVLSDDADGLVIADAVMMEPINVVINQPPLWSPVPQEQAIVNENFQYDISSFVTDPDGDDVFFTLVNSSTWANISTNGVIGGTPTESDLGQHIFEVQADDARGGTANTFVEVNVIFDSAIVLDIQLFNISDNQVKADRILTFDMTNSGGWKTALQYVRLEYNSLFTEVGWAVFMYTDNGTDINPFLIRLDKSPSGDSVLGWQTYRGLIGDEEVGEGSFPNRMDLGWMAVPDKLSLSEVEAPEDWRFFDGDNITIPDSWNYILDQGDIGVISEDPVITRLIDFDVDQKNIVVVRGGAEAVLNGAGGAYHTGYGRVDTDKVSYIYISTRVQDVVVDTFQTTIHFDIVHF